MIPDPISATCISPPPTVNFDVGLLVPIPILPGLVLYKKPASEAVLQPVVTVTAPVPPAPTVAIMLVDERMLKEDAGLPPKLTAVAPVKFVPVITTAWPTLPLPGVNEVMVTRGLTVRCKVATESHVPAIGKLWVYVPATL